MIRKVVTFFFLADHSVLVSECAYVHAAIVVSAAFAGSDVIEHKTPKNDRPDKVVRFSRRQVNSADHFTLG